MKKTLMFCGLLALSNLAVYGQVLDFEFLDWDDGHYLADNREIIWGLSAPALRWALTTDYFGNWHPLTWISYLVDYEVYGLDSAGFHATNLILHILNSCLLFAVLREMTGRATASAMTAALFAVHPLHVESVAWISERKDVLSTFFGFLSMGAYVRYARRAGRAQYLLTAFFLACSLLSKQTLVTLPLVFLLLDYWPLKRFGAVDKSEGLESAAVFRRSSISRLILEKIPLLAMSAISSIVIMRIQSELMPVAFSERVVNAVVALSIYLEKTVLPFNLSGLYPHPYVPSSGGVPYSAWQISFALALLCTLTLAAFRTRRLGYSIVGWLWFLGTLVPTLGLVQVANHALADRYTYFPLVGLFLIAAWGGADLLERSALAPSARVRLGSALAVLTLSLLAGRAHSQVGTWRDSISLYSHAVEIDPRNTTFRYNLAQVLLRQGRGDEAAEHYRAVLRIDPARVKAHINLGILLHERKTDDGAIEHLRAALQLEPENDTAHFYLGRAFEAAGEPREARRHFHRAITANADNWRAHLALAELLVRLDRVEKALPHYREVLRLRPNKLSVKSRLEELERFTAAPST